jgi:hypothetical protein
MNSFDRIVLALLPATALRSIRRPRRYARPRLITQHAWRSYASCEATEGASPVVQT